MLRVLAVIEAYSVTGPAKNLIEFSRRISSPSAGHAAAQVLLVTFQRGALDPPNPFVAAVREAGVAVHVIAERYRFDTSVISQLRRAIEDFHPDILQTHSLKSHFLVRLARLNRQRPWIAFHHGYTTPDLKMRLYNQLNRWSLPGAARVVAVCRQFSRDIASYGIPPERIVVRHNMVKPFVPALPHEIEDVRRELRLPPDARVLLSVGRLSQEKGHLDLIDAVAHLRRLRPSLSFRLVLVGEGPDRRAIERKAAALGVEDRITLAGHRIDVRPYYALADLLLMPSHSEGSPNVLLEAMSAGIPVAATSVGGIPEIAGHEENALLVARGDMDAMANAAVRLLEDPGLARRLADSAVKVACNYTPEAYSQALLQLYDQVLAERSGPLCACESR